jgi:hypothetical protein
MTPEQAAQFAIDTINSIKTAMINNGIADEQVAYAACRKVAAMLDLPLELVIDILTK